MSLTVAASPEEVRSVLLDDSKAILGTVPRLLHKRGEGVRWAPADDLCVAGELVAAEPSGITWAIQGSIAEVSAA